MSLVGADEHVEDRERPAAHGAHVGDVRDDGRGARGARLSGHEGRQDRLAAQHDPLVAVRDQRAVVAVADRAELLDEPQVALGEQLGRVSDEGREGRRVRHRGESSEIGIGGWT